MTKFEDIKFRRVVYKSGGDELEGLVFIPQGKGPFPLVTYVHGHSPFWVGAWGILLRGYFLQRAGFVAFLPSMPGYKLSGGNPDFCGPATVRGVVDGLKIVLKEPYVNKNKCGIWGVSRGAIVASQIITLEPDLIQAAVLQAGAYDLQKDFEWDKKIPGIKENMLNETNGTDEAWKERSSIFNMEKLKAPTLILHGEDDENISVEQARLLDKKLTELGKDHETLIMEAVDHFIPKEVGRTRSIPFLKKYLQ